MGISLYIEKIMIRRTAASTSTASTARILQRATTRRAVAGTKTVFSTLTPEIARERGITTIPTERDIATFDAATLYELAYGGSPSYFESSTFDVYRAEERKFLAGATKNVNVVESIYSCPKCKYQKIAVQQKQLRSGDESQTSQYRCDKCGYSWSISS